MLIRADVELVADTGVPEDAIHNTFHFLSDQVSFTEDLRVYLRDEIDRFYELGTGTDPPLVDFLSPLVINNPHRIYFYEVDPATGLSGSPIAEAGWGLPATGGTPLPPEVALVATFHADISDVSERIAVAPTGPAGDILPRARRRGRIYFGPLNTSALGSSGRPATTLVTSLANAAQRLAEGATLTHPDARLAVYSRADGVAREVTGGWVDDEFDTQRRRGRERTLRDTWVAA